MIKTAWEVIQEFKICLKIKDLVNFIYRKAKLHTVSKSKIFPGFATVIGTFFVYLKGDKRKKTLW